MTGPVVSVDVSEVREGKVDELKAAMADLVAFVEANEPGTVSYGVFFAEDGTSMSVLQVHPDSASMEFHMEIAGFPKLADLLTLRRVDVYGEPSAKLVEQLRRKAEALGGATVVVHAPHARFARLG